MEEKPDIDCLGVFPTIPVNDLGETLEWYQQKLGFKLRFVYGDPPTHGAVELGQATVHFFPGAPVSEGHWIYFQVLDVDEIYDWAKAQGVETMDTPTDQPWAMREFNLRDLNGYHIRFGASCLHAGEPLPIERVDVTVPLEKRLAALLEDLATHKNMTMSAMLEETLLHTFEAEPNMEGRSVFSPHTARTMRHIAELRAKHGIDYEVHDSYRFAEGDT